MSTPVTKTQRCRSATPSSELTTSVLVYAASHLMRELCESPGPYFCEPIPNTGLAYKSPWAMQLLGYYRMGFKQGACNKKPS